LNPGKSPKTWKCYGSNDGINFTEIIELSELVGISYVNNIGGKSVDTVTNISPYLYIGFVFGSLSSNTATQLELQQIELSVKEDITKSQYYTWTKKGENIYNITGNIGIGTSINLNSKLTIQQGNSIAPLTITQLTATSGTVLNDPIPIIHICRVGTISESPDARATFSLCRYENSSTTDSRTRLDILLAHANYDSSNIISIRSDGKVGIGITNPSTLLEVKSITNTNISNYTYFSYQTVLTTTTNYNLANYCAKFNGSIWVTSTIASSSDIRIKTNINDISDNSALLKILDIQPKTYNYIDIIEKGTNIVYGFIAQQIKEIIPEAVTIEKSIIPNIYSVYNCSNNIINITSNIENLKINDTISIIQLNNDRKNYTITQIIPELNQIKINENLEGSECFIYGTEVDDFHALNKDYIFTLNVCATQELHKIIQEQKSQIQELKTELENIKSILSRNNLS
jgi:hypothetical protein